MYVCIFFFFISLWASFKYIFLVHLLLCLYIYIYIFCCVQKTLQKQFQTYQTRLTFIHGEIERCFDEVFIHRYRDIDPSIRADSMKVLGEWILARESLFLKDSKLKYLGWCLFDKVSGWLFFFIIIIIIIFYFFFKQNFPPSS